MKVKIFCKSVLFENDVFERDVEVKDEEQLCDEKNKFAEQLGVQYSRIEDDIDPITYVEFLNSLYGRGKSR